MFNKKGFKKGILPLFASSIILLSSCSANQNVTNGSKNSENTSDKIVFWTTNQLVADKVSEYTENTGVKIEATFQGGYDDMVEKITLAIASKTTPNVAQLGQRHGLSQMYDSGALLAIEDYLNPELINDIIPEFWQRFTYKGKKIISQYQNSMPVLYYNKDIFEEHGFKTPDKFEDIPALAKEITDKTGVYGFTTANDTPWYILGLMSNAEEWAVEDNKANLNNNNTKLIFDIYSKMIHEDKSMPASQHPTAKEDFTNGKIAMIFTSCASYAEFTESSDFNVGVAMFPSLNGKRDIPMGGNGLGLFASDDKKIEESVRFIEYLLEPENVANNTLNSGYIPVTKAATQTKIYQEYLQDPNRQIVDEQMEYLGGAPVDPADSLVWNEIKSLLDSVEANKNLDLESGLVGIEKSVNEFLDNYNNK